MFYTQLVRGHSVFLFSPFSYYESWMQMQGWAKRKRLLVFTKMRGKKMLQKQTVNPEYSNNLKKIKTEKQTGNKARKQHVGTL